MANGLTQTPHHAPMKASHAQKLSSNLARTLLKYVCCCWQHSTPYMQAWNKSHYCNLESSQLQCFLWYLVKCSLPWQRIQIPIYFHNRIQNCWESTGHKLRKLSGSLWPSWICIWQRVDWMSNTNKHQLVTFLHRQLLSLHLAYCTIPTSYLTYFLTLSADPSPVSDCESATFLE